MFENSPAGLRILAAEVSVTVTREESHQAVLARYSVHPGQERRVAVELVWCPIDTGKHRGQRAIEVRLDGSRVGELTFLMSQRYAAMIEQVRTQGGRPGCEAYIERDARGLQISLRLPREAEGVTPLPVAAPYPAAPQPIVPKPQRTKSEKRAIWIVAASVVLVVFVLAGIFGGDDEPTAPLSGDTTTTTTFDPPPTTTTTTTTTTPPPTTTTTVPAPPPQQTQQPAPPPQTQQPAPPPVQPPAQPSGCDPNYTGCVPIDSDVDCAGGSGNGPSYADGPVQVVGSDIYDLDSDNDGTACE